MENNIPKEILEQDISNRIPDINHYLSYINMLIIGKRETGEFAVLDTSSPGEVTNIYVQTKYLPPSKEELELGIIDTEAEALKVGIPSERIRVDDVSLADSNGMNMGALLKYALSKDTESIKQHLFENVNEEDKENNNSLYSVEDFKDDIDLSTIELPDIKDIEVAIANFGLTNLQFKEYDRFFVVDLDENYNVKQIVKMPKPDMKPHIEGVMSFKMLASGERRHLFNASNIIKGIAVYKEGDEKGYIFHGLTGNYIGAFNLK